MWHSHAKRADCSFVMPHSENPREIDCVPNLISFICFSKCQIPGLQDLKMKSKFTLLHWLKSRVSAWRAITSNHSTFNQNIVWLKQSIQTFLFFFKKEKGKVEIAQFCCPCNISLCTGSESIRWEKGKGGDLRMGGQRCMEAVGRGRGGGGQKPYHAHQTVAANGIILNIISSFISHPCKHFPHHKVSIKAARNFCRFASFFNGIIVKI